jgi:hypothetical protein
VAKIELNRRGIAQLLKEPGTFSAVTGIAARIASAAGPGMETRSDKGGTRVRAAVVTATFEAMYAEATNRTLTRAIDAGRG